MKKHIKRLIRHEGYTLEISNRINKKFVWKNGIMNVNTGKNISSSDYRMLLGDSPKIDMQDKKLKIVVVTV